MKNTSDHVPIDKVLASAATDRASADVLYRAKPAPLNVRPSFGVKLYGGQ